MSKIKEFVQSKYPGKEIRYVDFMGIYKNLPSFYFPGVIPSGAFVVSSKANILKLFVKSNSISPDKYIHRNKMQREKIEFGDFYISIDEESYPGYSVVWLTYKL